METDAYEKYNGHRRFSKEFGYLHGLIDGINADGIIEESEMLELSSWCLSMEEFIRYYPFRDLIPMIRRALKDGVLSLDEIADILWVIDMYDRDDIIGDLNTQSYNLLHGIIHGVLADGVLDDDEITHLHNWINENNHLKGTYPYDEIESVITSALTDHQISEDERNLITALISSFIDIKEDSHMSRKKFDELRRQYSIHGICSMDPDILFDSKLFCFTGISSKATRDEIANTIANAGGLYNDSVLQKTDYLIVGSDSNPCWAFSCYGRKVEKAIEYRKKGKAIQIVNELDFWDAL